VQEELLVVDLDHGSLELRSGMEAQEVLVLGERAARPVAARVDDVSRPPMRLG
jgi:hypothetical protein